MKCRPSGRKTGQRWPDSLRVWSSVVAGSLLAAAGRDAIERPRQVGRVDDRSVRAPCAALTDARRRDRDDGSAGDVDRLELAFREEGDAAAVGRPERVGIESRRRCPRGVWVPTRSDPAARACSALRGRCSTAASGRPARSPAPAVVSEGSGSRSCSRMPRTSAAGRAHRLATATAAIDASTAATTIHARARPGADTGWRHGTCDRQRLGRHRLELERDVVGGLPSLVGVGVQTVLHDTRELGGHRLVRHFRQDQAQRVDVAARIVRLAAELFRRRVVRRAAAGRRTELVAQPGDAEVEELGAAPGDHDVGRLQVVVDDAAAVRRRQRRGDLRAVARDLAIAAAVRAPGDPRASPPRGIP